MLKHMLYTKKKCNPVLRVQHTGPAAIHMACLHSGNYYLNNVLVEKLMSEFSDCPYCTDVVETLCYYFVLCPAYNEIRQQCVSRLPFECWNVVILTQGSTRYFVEFNSFI